MIIAPTDPDRVLEWFHSEQTESTVLCILLAPKRDDQHKLATIIQNTCEADAIMGERIAFLLMHPNAEGIVGVYDRGECAVMRAGAFVTAPLRQTDLFRDLTIEVGPYQEQIAVEAARSGARLVPEFSMRFGVKPKQLPALCILVKGLDDEVVVVPLPGYWDEEFLLAVVQRVREAVDEVGEIAADRQAIINVTPNHLAAFADSLKEIQGKTDRLAYALHGLAGRYGGTEDDRLAIDEFLARGRFERVEVDALLDRLNFGSSEAFRSDPRLTKAMALAERIEHIAADIRSGPASSFAPVAYERQYKALAEVRTKLLERIGARNTSMTPRSGSSARIVERARGILSDIALVTDIGDIARRVLTWIIAGRI